MLLTGFMKMQFKNNKDKVQNNQSNQSLNLDNLLISIQIVSSHHQAGLQRLKSDK